MDHDTAYIDLFRVPEWNPMHVTVLFRAGPCMNECRDVVRVHLLTSHKTTSDVTSAYSIEYAYVSACVRATCELRIAAFVGCICVMR